MRLRGGALGLGAATRVLATGGGTASREILQVAADVFNAEVLVADVAAGVFDAEVLVADVPDAFGGQIATDVINAEVAADVFNAEVLVADVPDAAAVGAARRAAFALALKHVALRAM
ncbi:hypothetical protein T484DRAFT_1800323 [Baffinella frigidus]|nr:hypothetical protein T484DRAFT_1800323 [Cryptophyta sp. CCMP2293]